MEEAVSWAVLRKSRLGVFLDSYILHLAREGIRALFQRGVDVFFAGHLVAHLDALVEEDLVRFLDLFFGVFGDHVGGVSSTI